MDDTPKKKTGARRPSEKAAPASATGKSGAGKPRSKSTQAATKASGLTAVQISVADDYMGRFDDVAGRVKALGFEVQQELPDIGIMVGQMPAERVSELGEVEGVGFFERPRSFQVPPPESDVQ